jgi:hypothetical protein
MPTFDQFRLYTFFLGFPCVFGLEPKGPFPWRLRHHLDVLHRPHQLWVDWLGVGFGLDWRGSLQIGCDLRQPHGGLG